MRKILLISSIALLAIIWATAASATPPSIHVSTSVENFEIVACGDFNVRTEAEAKITEKLWFGGDGTPVRLRLTIRITSSEYYNDVYPNISISQGAKGVGEGITADIDFVTGAEHWTGNAFRLSIPGIGRVLWDVGTLKLDEDGNAVFHGQSFFAEGETGLALCEALAP